jgi:hypothetical protein
LEAPKTRPGPVVVVGVSGSRLQDFRGCRLARRIENSAQIDNDERGDPIYLCDSPAAPWPSLWPRLRHLS